MIPRAPRSTLFPYATLFRSNPVGLHPRLDPCGQVITGAVISILYVNVCRQFELLTQPSLALKHYDLLQLQSPKLTGAPRADTVMTGVPAPLSLSIAVPVSRN